MDKNKFTEYSEKINTQEEPIEVIVQVPEEITPDTPVLIIDKSGGKFLKRTLDEWSAINSFIAQALEDAGYEDPNKVEKQEGRK